jgi:CPA1 family monovalent cation:H+ antiporter
VFVLIGLQLPSVLAGVKELSVGKLLLYGGLFSVFLILLRLIWTFPGAYVSYFIRKRLLHQNDNRPGTRQIFVVGWTGMRGVIALAAAVSLPKVIADGSAFPHRDLIVFLTFCVILVTLVVQGLTLPALIRALGLAEASGPKPEELEARRLVLQAAQARLEDIRGSDPSGFAEVYDDLEQHYKHRLASLMVGVGGQEQDQAHAEHYSLYLDVSRTLLEVERHTALRLRNEGRITDEALREMENEMDLSEIQLGAALEQQTLERRPYAHR